MTVKSSATKARSSSFVGYSTKPGNPNYIKDPETRLLIGQLIEASTNAAFYAENAGKRGKLAYHQAQIELLEARPQIGTESKLRCKRTIAHHKAAIARLK